MRGYGLPAAPYCIQPCFGPEPIGGCLGPWLRTASALATLVALPPVAAAQDRNADASSFEASVALIRPTVQPPAPGDVSTDVAPADLLRPIEPDHRLEQNRNAFDDPPPDYDTRRFRIEPVPRKDRRIREFFEIEPYAPLGWRLGSFIFYSELEGGGGRDSNLFYQPSARSEWLAELDSETRLATDWDNHALEFRVRNGAGFYRDLTDPG